MFITVKVNMGQLTAEQRVFVVKNWFVTKSLEQVRQLFRIGLSQKVLNRYVNYLELVCHKKS